MVINDPATFISFNENSRKETIESDKCESIDKKEENRSNSRESNHEFLILVLIANKII
jgi:hypothetical protein